MTDGIQEPRSTPPHCRRLDRSPQDHDPPRAARPLGGAPGASPGRMLKTLEEIEFRPSRERAAMRADNSPLSVAYADPVLREEGLRSDRLGDATTFFRISEHQAHRVVCSCLNGRTIESGRAAQKVRAIARGTHEMLAGAAIAAMIGAPLFLYFF